MSSGLKSFAPVRFALPWVHLACGPHRYFGTFVERDVVLLRQKSRFDATPILTRPLKSDGKISTHKGDISHADIIGKRSRDLVTSSSGQDFRIYPVTLGEYVNMSRRLVTPIYPADANLIVSLFDLHVSPQQDIAKLEMLEAGTGHGALTLHLSRAIHAANSPKPDHPDVETVKDKQDGQDEESISQDLNSQSDSLGTDNLMNSWKSSRKAVIHTIDVSPKYSKHAEKVVRGFRHGLYADNIDFHVGDVSEWVRSEFSRRASSESFLSHAFLDLPSTHDHLSTVASALHADGLLIVFNPSITQIAECVQKIKREKIPLLLDETLELGNNGTSGGRAWDVRAVKPRATKKVQPTSGTSDSLQPSEPASTDDQDQSLTRSPDQTLTDVDADDTNLTLVCRPKVGDKVVGGGFLGVFRKMRDAAAS